MRTFDHESCANCAHFNEYGASRVGVCERSFDALVKSGLVTAEFMASTCLTGKCESCAWFTEVERKTTSGGGKL